MAMEPYICCLDPDTAITLKLYLFVNVKNVEDIRNNVIKGCWNCTILKPQLILDPFQVVVAANKAVVAQKYGGMVTRNVYSEILYNLSLTKNISQSLSKFGIESGAELLVCFLVKEDDDSSSEVLAQINGEARPLSDLHTLTDLPQIERVYRLKSQCDILDNIVSRIATKNFISF